jgi:transcriptional antiterminator/mannitol/fructose-specific phosphotransferase system IIA component (Ntr-type)
LNILRLLLEAREPLSSAGLASKLGLSARQVRYSLDDVERWLGERGVRLVSKPGYGVCVDATDSRRRKLVASLRLQGPCPVYLTRDERLQLLVFSLLTTDQPLIAKQLEPQLGVTRTTILEDMDSVEAWLAGYGLSLIRRPNYGFKVTGVERDWREAVVGFLISAVGAMPLLRLCGGSTVALDACCDNAVCLSCVRSGFFRQLQLDRSARLIDVVEDRLHVHFTDLAYISIALHLSLVVIRARQGRTVEIESEMVGNLSEREIFRAAAIVVGQLAQEAALTIAHDEIAYVAMQMSGARVRHDGSGLSVGHARQPEERSMRALVYEILSEAAAYLHPYLQVDQQLRHNLTCHLQAVVNRLRLGLPIRNPLVEQVKARYPYVFRIAGRSCGPLAALTGAELPEEEIAYIAMHLGAAMERLKPYPWVKRRVLVVCGEGVGTAWMLVSRIHSELPEIRVLEVLSASDLSHLHTFQGDVDAIISTVPLRIAGIPIVVVGPLLDVRDRAKIRDALDLEPAALISGGSTPSSRESGLAALLRPDTIRLGLEAGCWQEVVEEAGRLLLITGAVEPRYVSAMERTISEHGPYVVIAPGIALLHARPEEGVRAICMSLVTLNPPVAFGHPRNDPVDLVFALGAMDHHSHRKALAQLADLLGDPEGLQAIRKSTTPAQVARLVRQACLEVH